jgi:hypothetical protein
MIGPSKAERITEVVLCAFGIVGVIIFAAWSRSLFSIIFAAVMMLLLPFSLIRSRRLGEEEIIRRQDRAMGKPSDDPREMARWVP